jgi:hypothetical protein
MESTNDDLKNLKLKLEKEGEEKTIALTRYQLAKDADTMLESVTKIMKNGEKEFIEKTGRYMTYSEIREIYG